MGDRVALQARSWPATKTTTLAFRIEPALKEALPVAAKQGHRSIANMVEVMIRDYCVKAAEMAIAEPTLSGKFSRE